jgi:hypothetical protein
LEKLSCHTTNELIKKIWYSYTKAYYSAIMNNDIWFEGKGIQLEDIIISEANQAQKDKGYMLSLIPGRSIQNINIHKNKHDHIETQMSDLFVI